MLFSPSLIVLVKCAPKLRIYCWKATKHCAVFSFFPKCFQKPLSSVAFKVCSVFFFYLTHSKGSDLDNCIFDGKMHDDVDLYLIEKVTDILGKAENVHTCIFKRCLPQDCLFRVH